MSQDNTAASKTGTQSCTRTTLSTDYTFPLCLITLMLQDQYQYNENLWSGVGGYNPSSQASHFLPSSSTPCPTSHHTLSNAEVIINKNS